MEQNSSDAAHQPYSMRTTRAYQIVATRDIIWCGGGVLNVQSQSDPSRFQKVELHPDGTRSCSCHDWSKRRLVSDKHTEACDISLARFTEAEIAGWPAGYVLPKMEVPNDLPPTQREVIEMYDGARRRKSTPISYSSGPTEAGRRKVAASEMFARLPAMIAMLCAVVAGARVNKAGGREMLTHHKAFCVLFRTFYNRALHDTCGQLENYAKKGYIEWAPSVNSLCAYMRDPKLTSIFEGFIESIARTVRKIETMVAIDSTGFSTIRSANWLDRKLKRTIDRSANYWIKAHVACGAATGVVSGVILTNNSLSKDGDGGPVADTNFFVPLLQGAARVWADDEGRPLVKYALADKGYLSEANIVAANAMSIQPIIPIKRRWNPENKAECAKELYDFYVNDTAAFEEIYRYRSKIEGVFSSTKRACGHYTWSRGARLPGDREPTAAECDAVGVARRNELLAKFIVASLRRLVVLERLHSIESRVAVDFSDEDWAFDPLPPGVAPPEVNIDDEATRDLAATGESKPTFELDQGDKAA